MWAVWFISMDQRLYINALRTQVRGLSVSFTVLFGFGFFCNQAQQTENNWLQFWFLAGSDRKLVSPPWLIDFVKATSDVQRFERQG